MSPKIQQATKQINLRVPMPLLRKIDEARGDIPRERWIRRAIEAALNGHVLDRIAANAPDKPDDR